METVSDVRDLSGGLFGPSALRRRAKPEVPPASTGGTGEARAKASDSATEEGEDDYTIKK